MQHLSRVVKAFWMMNIRSQISRIADNLFVQLLHRDLLLTG